MPPGSPTCRIRATFLPVIHTQRRKFRFRVTAQDNNELQMSSIVFTNIKRAQAALNPSDRAEVTVRTAFEQDMTT
jgi:hypothetical protein